MVAEKQAFLMRYQFLNSVTRGHDLEQLMRVIKQAKVSIEYYTKNPDEQVLQKYERNLKHLNNQYLDYTAGVWLNFNTSFVNIQKQFEAGQFVVAYYKADRVFSSIEPKHVEKVQLKSGYAIDETPREEFIKYLGQNEISIFQFDDKEEFLEELEHA